MKKEMIGGLVVVKADKDKKTTMDLGGVTLYMDTKYDKYRADKITQDGVVVSVPKEIDGKKTKLKEGDKVYCHHFLTDKPETYDENHYQVEYNSVYCAVRDGEIVMMDGWNFIAPEKEKEEDFTTDSGIITKSSMDEVRLHGTAKYISDDLKELGVKQGDKVIFLPGREYDIDIEGQTLYRIRTKDICAAVYGEETV